MKEIIVTGLIQTVYNKEHDEFNVMLQTKDEKINVDRLLDGFSGCVVTIIIKPESFIVEGIS